MLKKSLGIVGLTIMCRGWDLILLVRATTVHIPPRAADSTNQKVNRGGANIDVNSKMFRRFVDDNRMPSLFGEGEDAVFDRYAACLAATEGLRRIRDRDLAEEVEMQRRGATSSQALLEAQRHITSQYVQNSGKVLRALGMTVSQFNELGRTIAQDDKLKQKVIEQAYLYRMAATINMDRSLLIEESDSQELLRAVPRDKVHRFCESMSEIESLRADQIERLKRALQVSKFPANVNISDPDLLPFLSPKVRAVVQAFPLQAGEIVRKHGLESDEFNKMLEETKSNPIFRWKIQKLIKTGLPEEEGHESYD